ncbi:chemotaxis protein CheA [Ectothiorhodospira shaposhnikovii]|uniref:chemotaxis protein CheA n=1 Tax=Ectothiorhodospira shaposhnikovii TaxID=1054 RepID=UPI001EE8E87A|nr:chemotaxis protein CheA [Ectothiorhodospira shaposhnikovii]MCG5514035.1 chemotaxis protein CheA [Ectothiorhodospira shaposhnikovii]
MSLSDALPTFLAEARGLLEEMEESLRILKQSPADAEAINALFRAAHTIKGSAGLFGLEVIVAFTHHAESVLDRVRDGPLPMDSVLIALFMDCRDHIENLIDAVERDEPPDGATLDQGADLVARLAHYLGHGEPDADPSPGAGVAPLVLEDPVVNLGRNGGSEDDVWHLSLRFGPDVLRNGMDPLSFIHYLTTMGEIVHLFTLTDAIPPAAEMDPEQCYLGFEIRLRSGVDKARLEGVFDFVREDSQIRILPPGSRLEDFRKLMESLPEGVHRLGEILVGCGAITRRELDHVLDLQASQSTNPPLLGEALVREQCIQPEVVAVALDRQQEVRKRQTQDTRLLRVRADKLDLLIDQVGELVIATAGLRVQSKDTQDSVLMESIYEVARLVDEIRDSAMNLRMVEIGETFNRFRRVVRDVCKESGKDIELVIHGADTQLDKTVVERLSDPLTHLIRNAVDHGIESPEQRRARGKPDQGQVRLNAFHEAGCVLVEVSDDGGGLDRERILTKARKRGLIPEDKELDDDAVWRLIFEPGFSTAQEVSNLSGRGVGMDVVRRDIDALRGSVEIETRPGEGTTFRMRLPLSLAIIDGFLVRVAGNDYVVPLDTVLECLELPPIAEARGDNQLSLRGEILPLLRLAELFRLQGPRGRRRNVVVLHWAGRKAGLLVDELKGQLQAVIKPLGSLFSGLPGVSGSTILGSGEVALVLDVSGLMDLALRDERRGRNGSRTDDNGSRTHGLVQ